MEMRIIEQTAASLSDMEARMDAKMAASEARILAAIRTIGGAAPEYAPPAAPPCAPPASQCRMEVLPVMQEVPVHGFMEVLAAPEERYEPARPITESDEDEQPAKPSPPVAVLRTKSNNANIKQLSLIAKDQLVESSAAGGVAGVIMSQGCIDQFNKARRGRNNVRWASFGWDPLGSGWLVPIEEADGTDDLLGDWDSFVANLPDQKPLFCFYNFTYFETDSMTAYGAGGKKTAMCLFTWMPDKITGIKGTKLKMKVSTTVATVKSGFRGVAHDKILRDKDDMDWTTVTDKISLSGALYAAE